ncbi:hypothetical protein B0T22DRAFT_467490 [Podospora appendiculata]|uniref:Glucose-methanol-choline oxidoreductase N-terminal domain-containing protein n=1 Tax=Podospora appendiculata TaxID=314037 RepID=A0AAE0X6V0_9PEZI|nr:hypothetical protein B0T22DRAFT_467490 [Podospora appendiculata]
MKLSVVSALGALSSTAVAVALRKVPEFATVVDARTVSENSYDFIVAGGGMSGLTVADRLTENPSVKVLVIEAGQFDHNEDSVLIPGAYFPVPYLWLPLLSVPQTALNSKIFNIPAGRVVGGGSVVNAMVYVRPAKEELKTWADLGATGWDWDSLLPYYKKSENITAPDTSFMAAANFSFDPSVHGTGGPVQASYPNFYFQGAKNFFEACVSAGLPSIGDAHAGSPTGVIYNPTVVDYTTRTRSHARLNHYERVKTRTNYHILAGYTVSRVLFKNKKVTGVEYLPTAGGDLLTAVATKEVLVAAGAIHTPQLLQLSGVGPAPLLRKFSIDVVADLPGVGANFHDQPSIIIPYNFTNNIEPNLVTLNTDPVYDAAQRARYDQNRTGPYVITRGLSNYIALPRLSTVTSKWRSLIAAARANNPATYLPAGTHPTVLAGYKLQRELTMKQYEGNVAVSMMAWDTGNSVRMYFLRPLSRGAVRINSSNPLLVPLIDPQTLVDPIDFDLVVAAFLKNRHIMTQPSMSILGSAEAAPFGNSITDEAQLKAILAGVVEPSSAHQCCTAAMMPKKLGGVVDPDMKVYDVKGLRVIDTSYWPMVLSAAPTTTTYASGEKVADKIKKEYRL